QAILVIEIAKNNGPGRTCLLASRQNFAILDWTVPLLRIIACLIDALNAIGAFLHYPARAHRYIRVAPHLHQRDFFPGIVKEVKMSHLIGTVVGAIACADAAVI